MPEIEFKNFVIKESTIATTSTFLFNKIPVQIIIELIRFVGIWINQDPFENGVSDVYYSQNIIMGQDLAYYKHCKIILWFNLEYHEYFKITNEMEEQKV